jgi:hypothetical protein
VVAVSFAFDIWEWVDYVPVKVDLPYESQGNETKCYWRL